MREVIHFAILAYILMLIANFTHQYMSYESISYFEAMVYMTASEVCIVASDIKKIKETLK